MHKSRIWSGDDVISNRLELEPKNLWRIERTDSAVGLTQGLGHLWSPVRDRN